MHRYDLNLLFENIARLKEGLNALKRSNLIKL